MGILKELFAAPVYGRSGARGDVALTSPGMYQRTPATHYSEVEAARQRLWELIHSARSGSLGSFAEIQALEQVVGAAEAERLREAAVPGLRRWRQPAGAPLPPLPPQAAPPEQKPQRTTFTPPGASGSDRSKAMRERRNAAPPEENLALLSGYLTRGEMTRDALLRRSGLKSQQLQAALDAGLASGKLSLRTEWGGAKEPRSAKGRSTHGLGSLGEFWSLVPEQEPPTQTEPTQASRYWLQAPPGGAQLNNRPYRSGQFIPGTTMFTHTPQKPGAPVPYAPLPEPQQPDMTQTGAAPQQDGTWAMPVPQGAGQAVQGAPQTVGGEAMFPAGTPPTGQPQLGPQQPTASPTGGNGLGVAAPPQVRPEPNTPQLIRTPGLTPQDSVLEAQTQQFAWANYPALRDVYFQTNAVLDPVSGDVRSLRIDADAWRELLPGYNGTNATATHAAAVYLNSQLFKEALQNQAGKGNNRMMVLAGGGGSGKGTAVNQFLSTADFPLILDQTSRDYGKLAGQFEAARAAGMQPSYLFVDRPAPTALHGAVERALEERRAGRPARTVPLEMLARTNTDARKVALQVLFAQPDVDAQVIDNRNTGRFQRRMITDRNDAAQYLAHRLREDEDALNNGAVERLRDEILARNKKGEIPADMVTGFLGEGWHIRPPVPLTPRRHGQ